VFPRAVRNPGPRLLGDVDPDPFQTRVAIEEVPAERQPERLRRVDWSAGRQGIHGILHGVRRKHAAVVAGGVGLVIVPLELDGDGEITQVVAIAVARHLHETDFRFAVRRMDEHRQLRRNAGGRGRRS
jgi:hypothetical protein